MPKINFINKSLISYQEAFDFQNKILNEKINQKNNNEKPQNHIIWCEHPHVYTLGKSGNKNNLLINQDFLKKINAEYFQTNRGGDITYHGPGQLVCYPIIDLDQFKIGIKDYVYILEQSVIELIKRYNIAGQIKKGAAGVWLDTGTSKERKICAIGVRVSRAVSMHGFALNLNTDLTYFNHINPCGFTDKSTTSVQKETGQTVDINEVIKILEEILPYNLKNFKKSDKSLLL